MTRKSKLRRRVGDVVAIPLGSGRFGFGWVLEEPLIAFFDSEGSGSHLDVEQIARRPIAFRIWVMNHAVTSGRWPVMGHVDVNPESHEPPCFFKQDPLSGRLTITRDGSTETAASPEQCTGLERAAVWEPDHVEDRLRDHFAGVPNRWVESMKPKG
jgi:hypothetical protein